MRYFFATQFTSKIFEWLLKYRSKDWVEYLENETVESMRIKNEPWIKKFVILGTQDFLDALASRKYRKRQNKNIIPKKPYLLKILNLLKIEYNPNQRREELERMINEGIEQLGIFAEG